MNKDTNNPLPTISFAEIQATMDYHLTCPKCGRNRRKVMENYRAGDHAALNTLRSCPECWRWVLEQYQHINNPRTSPVGTAKAGILEIIQDRNLGPQQINDGITAILEALVEDVRANAGLERKVRQ